MVVTAGSGRLHGGWRRLRCDAVGGGGAVDAVRGHPSKFRLHGAWQSTIPPTTCDVFLAEYLAIQLSAHGHCVILRLEATVRFSYCGSCLSVVRRERTWYIFATRKLKD